MEEELMDELGMTELVRMVLSHLRKKLDKDIVPTIVKFTDEEWERFLTKFPYKYKDGEFLIVGRKNFKSIFPVYAKFLKLQREDQQYLIVDRFVLCGITPNMDMFPFVQIQAH